MNLFRRHRRETPGERRERVLRSQILDLESKLESERRQIQVLTAEVETLAAVVARDRARVLAETAAYARQRAEQEGLKNG